MAVEHIGKYRVLAKLGQGGMARVLLTMSQGPHGFNKLLVVKELREELAQDPEFLAMFMDEARIAARLNHPNIVQTYEVGNDDLRYFIAMEYLEGQPLNSIFRRIGRKNIPLEIHLRILADVLAGLDHAHKLTDFDGTQLSVVHRDVSPQNVFVTYTGQVKLVDFGIAKAAGGSSRTQEGMLKGKISYIAPEQARCERVDARADLFAVGVMLWEAVAGRRMITKEDEMSVLARRMSGQDQSIREVVPDVPPDLAAICDRAMAPQVEGRFQSAKEFQEVLESYLGNSDYRVGPKEVGQLISSTFEDERTRIRNTIEEQMRHSGERGPINLELVPASLKQTSDSLARVMLPVHSSMPPPMPHEFGQSQTIISHAVQNQPKPRSLVSALAIGATLAIGALGVVVYLGRTNVQTPANANSGAPAVAEAATSTAGSTAAASAAPESSAAPKNTIAISLKYPEGAKAKIDGGYVSGNPFTANVPKDGTLHKIEVEQDGFKTEKRTVTFDKDVDLTIDLTSIGGRISYAPRVSPKPTATSEPTTPPPPPPQNTSDDPKPKPKPTVDIDESNPYKKK